MSAKARTGIIVGMTAIAGLACVVEAVARFSTRDWLGLTFFTILAFITQFWRLQLPGDSTLTVTFGIYFAMVLIYGRAATPAAFAAALVGHLVVAGREKKALLLNVANTALAVWITAALVDLAKVWLVTAPWLDMVAKFAGAPLVCLAINSGIIAAVVASDRGRPFFRTWGTSFRPLAVNYLLLSPIGAILAYVYGLAGIAGAGVFLVPLLMARYSFRLYLDKTKEVEDSMKSLRRYAEALEAVNGKLNQRVQELTALQDAATAVGANLRLSQTLDVLVDIIGRALGLKFGLVAVFADQSGDVELEVFHGQSSEVRINKRRCHELIKTLADTDEHLAVPIAECVTGLPDSGDTLYFLPLTDKGHCVGAIAVSGHAEEMGERLPALNVFRNQAANAIANARMYERMERMAITDGLTGLYNHRQFLELLDREFRSALRRQAPLALLVTDIDSFKLVNDTYGHLAGDQLVREISRELVGTLRRSDIIARFGGDEFVVILPNTSQTQAVEVAEKIRRRISSHDFRIGNSGKIHTTISVGVAAYPESARTRQELAEHADRAAYFSKQTGRNRVSAYSADMESSHLQSVIKGTPTPESYTNALQSMYVDAIRSLSYLVDAKDPYTYGHSTRVERLATELARNLGLPDDEVRTIQRAALLHDIGKVGVSEQILHKKAPLQEDEWEAIKRHPAIGAQIIRGVSFLEQVIPLVYHHQERFDGNGYPAGLTGQSIPLGARIIAVADAYEAMTSDRPYRSAKPGPEALRELRRCAGVQFDPALVERFAPLVENEIRQDTAAEAVGS